MTMDNPETIDVANGAGRLTIAKKDLDAYLAKGYKVPGGQVAPKEKAAQPTKKKIFSKKSEPKDNED